MADNTESAAAPSINLKVLSPSTEVNGDLFFPWISASTTVRELKLRIQNAISTRPTVERMRLIYRGRVVAKETDTLLDVFGSDNIRESADQSIHLVLRELLSSQNPTSTSSTPLSSHSASPAPRSSTAPPNPFRNGPTPPPQLPGQPTNPFRNTRAGPQPPLPHVHQQNPFGNIPIPPEVNQIVQQQIAQAMAQAQAHAHHHHEHIHNHLHPPQQRPDGLRPTSPLGRSAQSSPQNVPQSATQNQPERADTPGHSPNGDASTNSRSTSPGLPPTGPRGPRNLQPNTTSAIRHEHIGPNGERWTMTINSTNVTFPTQQRNNAQVPPNFAPLLPLQNGPPLPNRPTPTQAGTPVNGVGIPFPLNNGPVRLGTNVDQDLHRIRSGLQGAQREMENVRLLIQTPSGEIGPSGTATGTTPPTWRHGMIRRHIDVLIQHLDQLQTSLDSLVSDPNLARNRDVISLQMLNNNLRSQANGLSESVDRLRPGDIPNPNTGTGASSSTSNLSGASPSPLPAVGVQAQRQGNSAQPATAPAPEVFLLSGPQGPVGVLFNESGTFTTAPFQPAGLSFEAFNHQFNANRQLLATLGQHIVQHHQQAQPVNPPANPPAAAPAGAAQANGNQNPPALQDALDAQNDRLVNLAGHLWFLFKILCFIYFFAGGGGWRRPLMLGVAGAVVWLAQLGIFEAQFERVRRHFEALLPLAEQRDRHDEGAPGRAGQPTPEQAAQRLMRERNNQGFEWVRERLRGVERAVALFVASLWPGLGERMVRAREERVRAEREAEERRAAEEEQRRVAGQEQPRAVEAEPERVE